MNDFDQLLHEVLHEDANPQLGADISQKIAAGAMDTRNYASDARKMWIGVAAAIALGVIAWTLARTRMIPNTGAPAQVSISLPALVPEVFENHKRKQMGTTRRPAFSMETVQLRFRPQSAIRILPMEIEPLSVRPIVVAALEPGTYARKGKSK